jgi:sugar/nucleoside kinase (ribokinase family)
MRLACVGNALYDIIAFVETDFASSFGFHEGSTVHVEKSELESLLSALQGVTGSAGGGAVNSARIFSKLGFSSSFAGMIGTDDYGEMFRADINASGIDGYLQDCTKPTGVFVVMITPDGNRTIAVAPGAAPLLDASAVPDSFFSDDSVLYIDGFLASSPDTVTCLVSRAKMAGMRIALDIAGYRIALSRRDFFKNLIRTTCSWTFMNEDEFIALSESGVDESLAKFSADSPGTIVVKRAETGAVSVSDGNIVQSAVRPIRATDTTGAGDAFAAGFLSAALAGAPLPRCLRLGNRIAEHAIQVPGMTVDSVVLKRAAAAVS